MYKILVTKPIHPVGMEMLRKKAKVEVLSSVENIKEETMDKDAIILRIGKISNEIIETCSNLKVIAKHGVGVDEIDVATASKYKIPVINARGANANSVAEHTLAMLLAIIKNLRNSDLNLRKGNFDFRNNANLVGLKNKVFGIAGYGEIGKMVVNKCSGLNVDILVYDPYIDNTDDYEVEFCNSLDSLFERSDFVSLHMPLTSETQNIVGYKQLKLLGENGYLINCARGGVVFEKELLSALKDELIAGAALDVFTEEPPDQNNELFSFDNVLVTPHMAALSEEAIINMSTMVAEAVLKVLKGKMPENVVNINDIT